METGHMISRPVHRFSGAKADTYSSKLSPFFMGTGNSTLSFRGRNSGGVFSHGFADSAHLQYYVVPPRCGGKKEKSIEMRTEKKKLKLMKRLSKDLPAFSNGHLTGDMKGKLISEAAEVLLAELQHLKLAQKELRRKRKEEEALRKAALMEATVKCDSESATSSSSSESSDSDCADVVPMSRLRSNCVMKCREREQTIKEAATLAEPVSPIIQEVPKATVLGTNLEPGLLVQQEPNETVLATSDLSLENLRKEGNGIRSNPGSINGCKGDAIDEIAVETNGKKIEVCMGGKCKKLGAAALLEEFEREAGMEAAVVGCKCMGKCRTAPNVRVLNCSGGNQKSVDASVRPLLTNPLCIGVGLEDVRVIVADLLRQDGNGGYQLAPS